MKIKMRDGSMKEASFEEALGREAFRHTSAHILAQAIKRLYPDTKCAMGQAISEGFDNGIQDRIPLSKFHYDFDFTFRFSEENFPEVEAEMRKIVKENLQLRQFTADRQWALREMEERGEDIKAEILGELRPEEEISFYRQGEYLEMCAGPHLAYTSAVRAFKLLSVAGAYWRGDERNKMLTRIYGTSFPSEDMLKEHLNRLEEARRRDHRKLGRELGLFALFQEGPGFPFFLPKGLIVKKIPWEATRTGKMAERGLRSALEDLGLSYEVNPGDGAFYGPKIDFHLEDSIGRTWQCGTIQLDFQLPQRFGAEYIGEDGNKHRPIMIHRVVFGSLERFLGILIEHFDGKFPLWLAPVQVKVLPVSDKYMGYAREIESVLKRKGLRCETDGKGEKIGYKIRAAQMERIPYMLIVGEKERESRSVSVRKREEGDLGRMPVERFLEMVETH